MRLNKDFTETLPVNIRKVLEDPDTMPSQKLNDLVALGLTEDKAHAYIQKAWTLANSVRLVSSLLDTYERNKALSYFVSVGSVPSLEQFRAWLLANGHVATFLEISKEYPDFCCDLDLELLGKHVDGLYASAKPQQIKSTIEEGIVDYLQNEGEAQDTEDSAYCPVQLATGILVELEHADSFDAAKEIAKDHLEEDAEYYGKFIFPEEAQDRIDSITIDDYEPSEVVDSGIKPRLVKAIIQSGVLQDGFLKVSCGRLKGSYRVTPLTSGVLFNSEHDVLSLFAGADHAYFTDEEFGKLFSSTSAPTIYTVPMSVPLHGPISADTKLVSDIEHHEKKPTSKFALCLDFDDDWKEVHYYDSEEEANEAASRNSACQTGICDYRVFPIADIPAKYTVSNRGSVDATEVKLALSYLGDSDAVQLLNRWVSCPAISRFLARVVLNSDCTAFIPCTASRPDCYAADMLNQCFSACDPIEAILFAVASYSLQNGTPCCTDDVEVEFGSDVADCVKGCSLGDTDEDIAAMLLPVASKVDTFEVVRSLRQARSSYSEDGTLSFSLTKD